MWKPSQLLPWGRTSNQTAIENARVATTELDRRRVERQVVDIFLAHHRQRLLIEPRPA
jgi:hypothetical protein